jgi:hypothetical protein
MQTVFQVDGIRNWHEEYDHFEVDPVTAFLTVETNTLRHTVTAFGLQDSRSLNEVFHSCDGMRIIYDEQLSPKYKLEILQFGREAIAFPIVSFGVETRDLNQRRHKSTG